VMLTSQPQVHVTANIAVALKNLDDEKIREMLEAAGHTGWRRIESPIAGGK
jgi:hypothetical protein